MSVQGQKVDLSDGNYSHAASMMLRQIGRSFGLR
jgi:hypothetical protein